MFVEQRVQNEDKTIQSRRTTHAASMGSKESIYERSYRTI